MIIYNELFKYTFVYRNIEEMTHEQFRAYFEIVKPQILEIFEGKEDSVRNRLYLNKSHQDIRTLKSLLNVIRPFHEEHGNTLNTWLYEMLLPYSVSTLKVNEKKKQGITTTDFDVKFSFFFHFS